MISVCSEEINNLEATCRGQLWLIIQQCHVLLTISVLLSVSGPLAGALTLLALIIASSLVSGHVPLLGLCYLESFSSPLLWKPNHLRALLPPALATKGQPPPLP